MTGAVVSCLFSGTTMVLRKHFSLAVHQNSTKSLLFLTRREIPPSLCFRNPPEATRLQWIPPLTCCFCPSVGSGQSITHTALRMQVSGSRIKLWCPLISLALIQFFAPVSAQGNCCLHGSELTFCSGVLCHCVKYEMLSLSFNVKFWRQMVRLHLIVIWKKKTKTFDPSCTFTSPKRTHFSVIPLSKKVKRAKVSLEGFRWDRDVEKHLV